MLVDRRKLDPLYHEYPVKPVIEESKHGEGEQRSEANNRAECEIGGLGKTLHLLELLK